jgi:hypothetical protein
LVERRVKDGIPTVVRQDGYNIIKKRGKNAISPRRKSGPAGIGRPCHPSMCLSPDPPKSGVARVLGQLAAPSLGYVFDFAQLRGARVHKPACSVRVSNSVSEAVPSSVYSILFLAFGFFLFRNVRTFPRPGRKFLHHSSTQAINLLHDRYRWNMQHTVARYLRTKTLTRLTPTLPSIATSARSTPSCATPSSQPRLAGRGDIVYAELLWGRRR